MPDKINIVLYCFTWEKQGRISGVVYTSPNFQVDNGNFGHSTCRLVCVMFQQQAPRGLCHSSTMWMPCLWIVKWCLHTCISPRPLPESREKRRIWSRTWFPIMFPFLVEDPLQLSRRQDLFRQPWLDVFYCSLHNLHLHSWKQSRQRSQVAVSQSSPPMQPFRNIIQVLLSTLTAKSEAKHRINEWVWLCCFE